MSYCLIIFIYVSDNIHQSISFYYACDLLWTIQNCGRSLLHIPTKTHSLIMTNSIRTVWVFFLQTILFFLQRTFFLKNTESKREKCRGKKLQERQKRGSYHNRMTPFWCQAFVRHSPERKFLLSFSMRCVRLFQLVYLILQGFFPISLT